MFGFRMFKMTGKQQLIFISLVVIATAWSAFAKSYPLLSAVTMSALMIVVPAMLIVAFAKRAKRNKQQANAHKAAILQKR